MFLSGGPSSSPAAHAAPPARTAAAAAAIRRHAPRSVTARPARRAVAAPARPAAPAAGTAEPPAAATAARARPLPDRVATAKRPRCTPKVFNLSLTVCTTNGDIPAGTFEATSTFVDEECDAGAIALERGATAAHLHVQGVIRITTTSPIVASRRLKAALRWDDPAHTPVGAQVMLRALTGRNLHTWHGMIGYVRKDAGLAWFRFHRKGVSDEDLEVGAREHERLGAGPLKGRTQLTPHNVMLKAMNFWQYQWRGPRNGVTFPAILLAMLRSDHFYPAATWAIPYSGRGLAYGRMGSLWTIMTCPTAARITDIHNVFFTAEQLPSAAAADERLAMQQQQVQVDAGLQRLQEFYPAIPDFYEDPAPPPPAAAAAGPSPAAAAAVAAAAAGAGPSSAGAGAGGSTSGAGPSSASKPRSGASPTADAADPKGKRPASEVQIAAWAEEERKRKAALEAGRAMYAAGLLEDEDWEDIPAPGAAAAAAAAAASNVDEEEADTDVDFLYGLMAEGSEHGMPEVLEDDMAALLALLVT